MSRRSLPPGRPSLEQLKKQARENLRRMRASSPSATLAGAQHALAREYGFASWAKLMDHVNALRPPELKAYDKLARQLAAAYMSGDAEAIRELNWSKGTAFAWFRDHERMHSQLPAWSASSPRDEALAFDDARLLIARSHGFASWVELAGASSQPPADPRSASVFHSTAPPYYRIDWAENRIEVRGPQLPRHWDTICAVMKEHGIARLSASGIDDGAMPKVAKLGQITHLHVENSKSLTDAGLAHVVRMPLLEDLEIGGPTSGITSEGFAPLAGLRNLRRFQCCWARGVTDAGAGYLAGCEALEDVNMMGTPTGDGLLKALAGKPRLRQLNTGRLVTDGGLALLHEIPPFKTASGASFDGGLMSFRAGSTHVLLDGPFTDAGLAGLAGLDGLAGLSFFWHCPNFTSAGLAALRSMSNLGFLGCQGANCDDEAMRHIAAIPRLRMLMGQGAVAGDEGFHALAQSPAIEYFWGRECPNLTGAGFAALAAMPGLRGLAVSCKRVGDDSLSLLPAFPALTDLMPMDVTDDGFRHVGQCSKLERLWCMYCRDTGDEATGRLTGLTRLRTYYAGQTRITDRSLEILAKLRTLEEIELWQCGGVTDTGVAHLAALPNLRRLTLDGLAGVSRKAAGMFPPGVRVINGG
ncbi:MAG: hypothetical protein R2729_22510 [Bryobacteraceae bacterium]